MNKYAEWLEAKEDERAATERRRQIEDELSAAFELPEDYEGTQTVKDGGYKIVLTGRMNRKVDSEAVQELAAEIGAESMLSTLFRWKPEINAKAWQSTDKSVTDHLSKAITTKPGRVSWKIEKLEGETK